MPKKEEKTVRACCTAKSCKASSPSEWSGWERERSYCERCFSKFLKEHTWQWFLEERVKDGWVPPDNCGFGYNCKTMVEDDEHAEAKNSYSRTRSGPLEDETDGARVHGASVEM
ncbi:hypothetical protein B0H19DRAFT_1084438 [Mycena capillaripes]|nr:hypothetical protein B0H19DRAFT_1084438 [Mycena capillaripes]